MKKNLHGLIACVACAAILTLSLAGCGAKTTQGIDFDPSIRIQTGKDADAPAGRYIRSEEEAPPAKASK